MFTVIHPAAGRDGAGKGSHIEEVFCGKGGKCRGSEGPAEDDDLLEPDGSGEFTACGNEPHD